MSFFKELLEKCSPKRWWFFKSGTNLTITAFASAVIVLLLVANINNWWSPVELRKTDAIIEFFNSVSSSFVSSIIFFVVFTWGLLLVNKRRPFFRVLADSEDFTDDEVRIRIEESIRKLAAFNKEFDIELDIRKIDITDMKCELIVSIVCEIVNLSATADYNDLKIVEHDPTGINSKESCKIIKAVVKGSRLEAMRSEERLDESATTPGRYPGGTSTKIRLHIAPGKSKWTHTLYNYEWPLLPADAGRHHHEEHNFSSPRVTKQLTLRARNSSETLCCLIIDSTREGYGRSVILQPKEAIFKNLVTIPMVQSDDTGALQVYVAQEVVQSDDTGAVQVYGAQEAVNEQGTKK